MQTLEQLRILFFHFHPLDLHDAPGETKHLPCSYRDTIIDLFAAFKPKYHYGISL